MAPDDDDEIQEAVMEAELESEPLSQPTAPAPATTPQPTDTEEDEYYEGEGGILDRLAFGPLEGKTVAMLGAVLVVVILLLASLFIQGFGFYKGVKSIWVEIDTSGYQPGVGPDSGFATDNDLRANAYLSEPIFGRPDTSDGTYTIGYDGEKMDSGTVSFSKRGQGEVVGKVNVPFEEFYLDNGEYTLTVEAGGKKDSDTISIYRTAKALSIASVIDGDNYMRQSLKLRPTSNPLAEDYEEVVATKGNGTLKIIFVPEGKNRENEGDWETVETIDYFLDFDKISWIPRSNQNDEQKLDDVYMFLISPAYYDEGDGNYSVDVVFFNQFVPDNEGAFHDPVTKMSGWVVKDDDD